MVDPSVAEVLTSGARKLTKADILALGGFLEPAKSAKDLGLSVDDVRSLELAFHQDFQGGRRRWCGPRRDDGVHERDGEGEGRRYYRPMLLLPVLLLHGSCRL